MMRQGDLAQELDLVQELGVVVKGHPFLSPTKFMGVTGQNLDLFATRARFHPNTATRSPEAEGIQSYIRAVLQVLAAPTAASRGGL